MAIFMFVGRHSDPFFIYEIFKVNEISQIDKAISEDEIFQDVAESPYLNSLYNIINQIRYQRQPFCEIQVILDGEVETEKIVQSLCIVDEGANPRYKIDFSKFVAKIQAAGASNIMQGAGQV